MSPTTKQCQAWDRTTAGEDGPAGGQPRQGPVGESVGQWGPRRRGAVAVAVGPADPTVRDADGSGNGGE